MALVGMINARDTNGSELELAGLTSKVNGREVAP